MSSSVGARWSGVAVVVVIALAALSGVHAQQPASNPNEIRATEAQLDKWMKELSNWGRWGKDDQLGAVNTITPEKRKQAAALVRTGESVSLAHDLDLNIQQATQFQQPFVRTMGIFPERGVTRDQITLDPHGGAFTHLDALCHMAYKGRFYNDTPYETATPAGCAKMGINGLKDGIVTRGVLLDIPRLRNLPYLAAGTHVYREDIEAWEKQAGVKVAPGDALFLRTGRWARPAGAPGGGGYDASFLPFLKDRDVALLGSDTAQDVGVVPGCASTAPSPTMCWLPVHKFALVARGMNLFDNLDLEAVAATAAKLKRWEFLLMASPIRMPGGTGTPINPIAVF